MSVQPRPASIGQPLAEVDTPALVLDLDAFEKNLATLNDSVKGRVRVRPHAKTHKCPEVAKRQMALGAVGSCCQKVSEAEAMVEGGVRDVLVSNEIVGARKLARLAALSRRAKIGVCIDSVHHLRELKASGADVDVYVEIEVGMKRCGIAPGAPASRSPTGRTPQERSREPHQRVGSTASRSSPTVIVPLQAPCWVRRVESMNTRPFTRW